jgi:hypothetical protein
VHVAAFFAHGEAGIERQACRYPYASLDDGLLQSRHRASLADAGHTRTVVGSCWINSLPVSRCGRCHNAAPTALETTEAVRPPFNWRM